MNDGHNGICNPATNPYVHGIDASPNTIASDHVSVQLSILSLRDGFGCRFITEPHRVCVKLTHLPTDRCIVYIQQEGFIYFSLKLMNHLLGGSVQWSRQLLV